MRAEELIKELEKISQGISMKAPETNRLIVNVEKERVMPVLRFFHVWLQFILRDPGTE